MAGAPRPATLQSSALSCVIPSVVRHAPLCCLRGPVRIRLLLPSALSRLLLPRRPYASHLRAARLVRGCACLPFGYLPRCWALLLPAVVGLPGRRDGCLVLCGFLGLLRAPFLLLMPPRRRSAPPSPGRRLLVRRPFVRRRPPFAPFPVRLRPPDTRRPPQPTQRGTPNYQR